MEVIELKLDEENELYFNVQVEGTTPGSVTIRLMCESDDFSASFDGRYSEGGEVKVVIPEMKKNKSFQENKNYQAQLEVMIENKFFIPLKFDLKFKDTVKVYAEVSSKNEQHESKLNENNKNVVEVKKYNPVVSAVLLTKEKQQDDSFEKRKNDIFSKISKKIKLD